MQDYTERCCREFVAVLVSKEPVPGGVGTVTTSVLVKHVLKAAERVAGR